MDLIPPEDSPHTYDPHPAGYNQCFMPPVFIVRRQLSNHSVLVTCPQSFTPGLDQALGLQMSNIIIIIIIIIIINPL